MKKLFLIFALALGLMGGAHAQNDGLTAEQRAQVAAWTAENKDPANKVVNVSKTVRTEAREWGTLLGEAVVSGAKQLNIAAEDFSNTTIGKVTIAVVVYKVLGRDVVRFTSGFLIWIAVLFAGWHVMRGWRSKVVPDGYTVELRPVFWGLFEVRRKTNIQYRTLREESDRSGYMACGLAVMALGTGLAALVAFA